MSSCALSDYDVWSQSLTSLPRVGNKLRQWIWVLDSRYLPSDSSRFTGCKWTLHSLISTRSVWSSVSQRSFLTLRHRYGLYGAWVHHRSVAVPQLRVQDVFCLHEEQIVMKLRFKITHYRVKQVWSSIVPSMREIGNATSMCAGRICMPRSYVISGSWGEHKFVCAHVINGCILPSSLQNRWE